MKSLTSEGGGAGVKITCCAAVPLQILRSFETDILWVSCGEDRLGPHTAVERSLVWSDLYL